MTALRKVQPWAKCIYAKPWIAGVGDVTLRDAKGALRRFKSEQAALAAARKFAAGGG